VPTRCLVLVLALVGVAVLPAVADAQRLVILVRHAERADGGAPQTAMTAAPADPDISAEGRVRADRLAEMLARAGITKVIASEFKRTQQTAAPIAARLGITPEIASSKDVPSLVDRLAGYKDDVVLIVGHNTTVPAVIAGLGGPKVVIPDTDYANLFVFVPATRTLTTLRY
jgi:phosphohistidine phosphatase SixA